MNNRNQVIILVFCRSDLDFDTLMRVHFAEKRGEKKKRKAGWSPWLAKLVRFYKVLHSHLHQRVGFVWKKKKRNLRVSSSMLNAPLFLCLFNAFLIWIFLFECFLLVSYWPLDSYTFEIVYNISNQVICYFLIFFHKAKYFEILPKYQYI